jgi:hypothetical protein
MKDMSFLTILSLVSITVPGIAKIIQSALFGFICMDLLYTDRWLVPILTSFKTGQDDDVGQDKPLNPYFEQNGFTSMRLVNNLGSTMVYLFIYVIALLLLPLLNIFGKNSVGLNKLK